MLNATLLLASTRLELRQELTFLPSSQGFNPAGVIDWEKGESAMVLPPPPLRQSNRLLNPDIRTEDLPGPERWM